MTSDNKTYQLEVTEAEIAMIHYAIRAMEVIIPDHQQTAENIIQKLRDLFGGTIPDEVMEQY
jgi:hypothetical protein